MQPFINNFIFKQLKIKIVLKFFRKIRQNLVDQNKISKYLVYAIGEIVLVVIGILIALEINNNNQQNLNEAKTQAILKEIQKDLEDAIYDATRGFDQFVSYDSIQYLLLNNKLTEQDFYNDSVEELGLYYSGLIVPSNGYDNLMRTIDNVPEKFKDVVADLNNLYVTTNADIKVYNKRIQTTVYDYLDYRYKQPWAHNWVKSVVTPDAVEYFMNSAHYKSYLLKFMNDRGNLFAISNYFRVEAIKTHKKISKLLKEDFEETNTFSLKNKDEKAVLKFQGDYHIVDSIGGNWSDTIKVALKENELHYFFETLNNEIKMYHHKDGVYFNAGIAIFNFRNDTLFHSSNIYGKGIYVKTNISN